MKRLIEMTIVSLILLGVAFCFGCKEKAEAAEPNELAMAIENGDLIFWVCKHENIGPSYEKCYDCGEYIILNEPETSEPNEPKTYTAEELDEIYKDEPALGRLAKDLYGVGEGRIVLREDWHKLIPTWPDYIELEKNLIIEAPDCKWEHTYTKGTKIYFKE